MNQAIDVGKICAAFPDLNIRYLPEVDSTNDWAKREQQEGLYLTEHQVAGKGSRGRNWSSPKGTSIAMTLALRPDLLPERISLLTLVMGLAAAEGVEIAGSFSPKIKWPNDLVIGGKKLCGILTELCTVEENAAGSLAVIGIGMNVNMDRFPEEIAGKATSIATELGHSVEREPLVCRILERFFVHYHEVCRAGSMRDIQLAYEQRLVNLGEKVRVQDLQHPFCGTAVGIDAQGRLLVAREDNGHIEKVFAGEVSVRGVYGYV